jgi:hypothetical protein
MVTFKCNQAQENTMPETDRWLTDYGNSHRSIGHPAIYWLAVPLLATSTVGMLWSLPVPLEFLEISPLLNWGSVFLMAAVVYYFIISVALAIGMLPFVFAISGLQMWLTHSEYGLAPVSAGLFVASTAGLYLGQHASGGIKAVFQDIQMMMIAPVWLLSRLYQRAGIPF